jgi:UDP-N-acetylmuramate dehydrogenase
MLMAAEKHTARLIDRLPAVRGEYRENMSLARYTWFRVGGPVEIMYLPADPADLKEFLQNLPANIPVTVIGVASNLLIRDGGIPGVVVRLRHGFTDIKLTADGIQAGAGALDINIARFARDNARAGLEFLSGVPGTLGGAVRMNAGAYKREISDVLNRAHILTRDGQEQSLDSAAMGFEYRKSTLPEDCIVVSAELQAPAGDPEEIADRMAAIGAARAESQPIRDRTGGSTFKNPPGYKAWQLIEQAGCRGLVRGRARVSDMHCNFLINEGDATAQDLESLGEEVRRRVLDESGITLEWEIRRIGVAETEARR